MEEEHLSLYKFMMIRKRENKKINEDKKLTDG
jgi:hypothetical protein